jgi:hypothetical protein
MRMHSTRYILRSSELIDAPSVLSYARHMYNMQGKGSRIAKRNALNILSAWDVPKEIVRKMLDPTTVLEYDDKDRTVIYKR